MPATPSSAPATPRFGPGLLVAAAFIGPGTVATASVAGAHHGFALLWALLFSVITTMILQEMAVRLGVIARLGLAEALRQALRRPWLRGALLALIIAAIAVGNAAYEAGNLLGAALGAQLLVDGPPGLLAGALGVLAAALLFSGRYGVIERVLMGLVAAMSVVFVATMLARPPDLGMLADQLVPEALSGPTLLTALALVGTTVVPYNLFLHASIVQQRWSADLAPARALREARWDAGLSIGLGGLVTLAIMSTAATSLFVAGAAPVDVTPADLARQLEPLLGSWAQICFACGLLAAGLTSAITAPLAAAYAVAGALGWPADLADARLRWVWGGVLAVGIGFAVGDVQPLPAILFAQAANALLLPVIAMALLWIMNRRELLGAHRNGWRTNLAGAGVIAVTCLLGGQRLLALAG